MRIKPINLIEAISPFNIIDRANLAILLSIVSVALWALGYGFVSSTPFAAISVLLGTLSLLWALYLFFVIPQGALWGQTPPGGPNGPSGPGNGPDDDNNPPPPEQMPVGVPMPLYERMGVTLRVSSFNPWRPSRERAMRSYLYHKMSESIYGPITKSRIGQLEDEIDRHPDDEAIQSLLCPISAELILVPVEITKSDGNPVYCDLYSLMSLLHMNRGSAVHPYTRNTINYEYVWNLMTSYDTQKAGFIRQAQAFAQRTPVGSSELASPKASHVSSSQHNGAGLRVAVMSTGAGA